MNLFTLLNANNYLTVNREIAREMGLNAAIFLSEIIDKYCYFESRGGLKEDGWFYLTVEDVEDRTTLAKDAQAGAIRLLKDWGFIDTKQMGMPAKRHFKVFKEKITEWVNPSNKKEEPRQQAVENPDIKESEKPTPAPIYKSLEEEPRKHLGVEGLSDPSSPLAPPIYFSFDKRIFENISPQDLQSWKEAYPATEIETELKKMAEWCLSNPQKSKSKKKWRQFITGWLSRDNEKRVNSQAYSSQATKPTNPNEEANREALRSVNEHLRSKDRPIKTSLRGKFVYDSTGDSISLDLLPERFLEILCKWNGLKVPK